MTSFATAQLCDRYADYEHFQIADFLFRSYGAKDSFSGRISTLKTFEDSGMIELILSEKVENRVLVIDGGGSHRSALFSAKSAMLAVANGWEGLVIYGCLRDSAQINKIPIGVRALHSQPLMSHKKDHSERDVPISFAGVNFKKDHFLYADEDGIVVSETMLS